MRGVAAQVVQIYIYVVIISIVLSWFRVPGDHPVAAVQRAVDRVVDPVLAPIRRMLPAVRVGGMGLDLSPIILILGLQFLLIAIR